MHTPLENCAWRAVLDSTSGQYFYWNEETGVSQWDPPDLRITESVVPNLPASSAAAEQTNRLLPEEDPCNWQAVWEESAQAYYYWNATLGVSQWDIPVGFSNMGQRLSQQSLTTDLKATMNSAGSGWEAVWDEHSERYFYWNATTGISTWELPANTATEEVAHPPLGHAQESTVGVLAPCLLTIEELPLTPFAVFDPSEPVIFDRLVDALGVSRSSVVEKLSGFQGGLNDGVWALRNYSNEVELILKLVQGTRKVPELLTEAENFVKLSGDFSDISSDPSLAFPMKLFGLLTPQGDKLQDLIIMLKVPGVRLSEVISTKWRANEHMALWEILRRVGVQTAEFHAKYRNTQHTDLQPSNVYWDESSGKVFFIDVGGMGKRVCGNDLEHFSRSLKMLSGCYGPQLESEGWAAFLSGYKSVCPDDSISELRN